MWDWERTEPDAVVGSDRLHYLAQPTIASTAATPDDMIDVLEAVHAGRGTTAIYLLEILARYAVAGDDGLSLARRISEVMSRWLRA